MISARLGAHQIAVKLHRTVEAVRQRARKLSLSFKPVKAKYEPELEKLITGLRVMHTAVVSIRIEILFIDWGNW